MGVTQNACSRDVPGDSIQQSHNCLKYAIISRMKFTVPLPCSHPQLRIYDRTTDIIRFLHRDSAVGMQPQIASTINPEVVHYE